eukprot:550240_1
MLFAIEIVYASFIIWTQCHDVSNYSMKSQLVCDEFYDLKNWNISNASITYHPLKCPNKIAPCLYFSSYTNSSAVFETSTTGFEDIELIWDMKSFCRGTYDSILKPTISGQYSCNGNRHQLNDFFIIDWDSALNTEDGKMYFQTDPFDLQITNEYFVNQYFKLPSQCNNQQTIFIQIQIINALSIGKNTYADFSIDNFCLYGNPTDEPTTNPTLSPSIDVTAYNTTQVPSGDATLSPTECENNQNLENEGCTDDGCDHGQDKPYLYFTLSFSVCTKRPFVGNRYGLWNAAADCLCELGKNGEINYVNFIDRRRLKRGDNTCNLNVVKYAMKNLTKPISIDCNTNGYQFDFTIEQCGECVGLTQTLNKLNTISSATFVNAMSSCVNWFSKKADSIGFENVKYLQYDIKDQMGKKCEVTAGVRSNFLLMVILIIFNVLSLILVI